MTITLERPRAQAAYFDTRRVLPTAAARTRTTLPAGGRLVRQRTGAAPTLSLSRKLKMLAPAALLAGVSTGGVAVAPHVAGLLDGIGEHLANTAATVTPDQVVEQHAAPKHRATSPDLPDVVPAPRHQPTYQPKHRAPDPADASRPAADSAPDVPATTPAGTRSPGGAHAAAHPSPAPATATTGGKHRAPSDDQGSTGDHADSSPTRQDAAPPAGQSPSPDSHSAGSSSGPVTGLVTTVDDTVETITGLVG